MIDSHVVKYAEIRISAPASRQSAYIITVRLTPNHNPNHLTLTHFNPNPNLTLTLNLTRTLPQPGNEGINPRSPWILGLSRVLCYMEVVHLKIIQPFFNPRYNTGYTRIELRVYPRLTQDIHEIIIDFIIINLIT